MFVLFFNRHCLIKYIYIYTSLVAFISLKFRCMVSLKYIFYEMGTTLGRFSSVFFGSDGNLLLHFFDTFILLNFS